MFSKFMSKRKSRKELEALSDATLKDLGINRGEIYDLVERLHE